MSQVTLPPEAPQVLVHLHSRVSQLRRTGKAIVEVARPDYLTLANLLSEQDGLVSLPALPQEGR